ncbi:hypothetical protein G7046_g5200 [Stylonectria norvegica]|nr:hypothetical protein G7046_g5200 [Stylonectria norvegica]
MAPTNNANFGEAVAALLDTYSQCLALLKRFRHHGRESNNNIVSTENLPEHEHEHDHEHHSPGNSTHTGSSTNSQARLLARSLRQHRTRVGRAYSASLSQNGPRVHEGDAAARSSLRRVLERLTTAVAHVVRVLAGGKKPLQPTSLDYDSFMSLSSAAGLDAIRTIDDLSGRVAGSVGSRSATAVSMRSSDTVSRSSAALRSAVSSRSAVSPAPTKKSSSRHSPAGRSRGRPRTPSRPPRSSAAGERSDNKTKAKTKRITESSSGSAANRSTHRHSPSSPSSSSSSAFSKARRRGHGIHRAGNRISMVTMASDSTKLGEIRRRESQTDPRRISARVTYPLYSHYAEAEWNSYVSSSSSYSFVPGCIGPHRAMPQDPTAALSSLLRTSTIDDHDEILKAANAAIKANRSDVVSQHTRVVALLKLDRFDDALRAIAEGGLKLNAQCCLEKSYALYKTGKLDEATGVLQSVGLGKRSFTHVAAQVNYRAERFDEVHNMYSRLLDTEFENEENDLYINIQAARAQAEWQGFPTLSPPKVQDSDGFELCYNAACAYIARGSLDAAQSLLQRALGLCEASDELVGEDKEAELRPILAQQAYVYACMGNLDKALQLYQSIGAAPDSDPDFNVVAHNNLLALDAKPDNPYLLQRKFESLAADKAMKLFTYQSRILHRNSLIVDLQVNKANGVKKRTEQYLGVNQHPTAAAEINVFSVLNAAAHSQGQTGKQVVHSLLALAEKRPEDVGLVLTIVQIQLQSVSAGAALSTLSSFLHRLETSVPQQKQDIRFCPGLVALAVALMRAQGRESSAKAELIKAANHWKGRAAGPAASLLREAGIELLKSSNRQDLELAGASFQKLFDGQQGSHIASAGLVASLAPSDPERIQKYLADLPPIDELIEGIDVAALIKAGVATAPKSAQPSKRSAPDDSTDKASKRRRKTKLPKNYEPGTKPDPERWLPLRDRSSYRPKDKKGKKKALDATQGGVVKEETLELVGGGGVKVEKALAPNSKKKKKGKK